MCLYCCFFFYVLIFLVIVRTSFEDLLLAGLIFELCSGYRNTYRNGLKWDMIFLYEVHFRRHTCFWRVIFFWNLYCLNIDSLRTDFFLLLGFFIPCVFLNSLLNVHWLVCVEQYVHWAQPNLMVCWWHFYIFCSMFACCIWMHACISRGQFHTS